LQWYGITGVGLIYFLIRTMKDVVSYDYTGAHFLDPEVIQSKVLDPAKHQIVDMPGWLRAMSLAAPWIGTLAFVISISMSLRLISHSLKFNSSPVLHKCIDQLLIVIGAPQVFVLFFLRALVRQWEVMTWSFCWRQWGAQGECPDADATRFLVRDECKLDMYFAQTFQFLAMWEFGQLCGHFLGDSRIIWHEGTGTQTNGARRRSSNVTIMKEYRSNMKWAAALALYAFAGIGMAKSVVEFGMTVVLNMRPDLSVQLSEKMDVFQKKVNTVFGFATILCVINMFLISKLEPLKQAMGANINYKFHGTRTMLLVLQIQPQVLDFFTIKAKPKNPWWTFLHEDQAILLNVTLVLYWCLLVSVASVIFWGGCKRPSRGEDDDKDDDNPPLQDTVRTMYEKALAIDEANADDEQENPTLVEPLLA
jgi:hypothetical protein